MDVPYWLEKQGSVLSEARFDGRADVAIVGAGVTGCSAAACGELVADALLGNTRSPQLELLDPNRFA